MSRVPVRLRLTTAFALATVLVLAGAGLFVYLRLKADLDETINTNLHARAAAVAASGDASTGVPPEADEGFAEVLGHTGAVLDHAGGARPIRLPPAALARAAGGRVVVTERAVAGAEGTSRVLARASVAGSRAPTGRRGAPAVVVVGQSLGDRDATLADLVRSLAIAGPAAVLLASLIGYGLAAAGLAPVEAMRRRAREVSLSGRDDPLPLPAARDEIRRLGVTLNEMLDRLRGSFERERRFVADAGHELRTPVAIIKAEIDGALRRGGHEPDVQEALTAAAEECDHLVQLADDLLVVARSGDGELPVRLEPVGVAGVLEGVRLRFADRARERGREVRVEAPDGLHVTADELRLRQALANLVDNALRYGTGPIVLRGAPAGGGVALEVADAGSGFAPDIAPHAFERFARGDGAGEGSGTGLGLAIVSAIAQAHGGHAELAAGPGSVVRIWLPGAAPSPQPDLS